MDPKRLETTDLILESMLAKAFDKEAVNLFGMVVDLGASV